MIKDELEIITKHEYVEKYIFDKIEFCTTNRQKHKKEAEELWNKLRGKHNFIFKLRDTYVSVDTINNWFKE